MKSKPIKVKAWPELVGFQPSLPVFREMYKLTKNEPADVEVDFGSVRTITSTGLAVFLLRLLRLLGGRRMLTIRRGAPYEIYQKLEQLGVFDLLDGMTTGTPQKELSLSSDGEEMNLSALQGRQNLRLYRLNLEKSDNRRGLVHRFKLWLFEQLRVVAGEYDVAPNGLVMMIAEIAKNTADHAASDALFGLDVEALDHKRSKLAFVFGDLGIGIKQHIEINLPPSEESRRKHMSLYEAYRLALKPGYTSNHVSSVNRGHGMSIIVDCATDMQMHLSVFDASSRGLLSNLEHLAAPSHAGVRRIFHHVGHSVGFFYFGEVVMTRRRKT